MTFLIADDSHGKMTMLLHEVKRVWTGKILTATTTEEAMALIDANPDIAAAFIDYYIPSKNGPAIIQHLKKNIPSARVALVSSSENAENAAEARAAGAEAVICTTHKSDDVEREIQDLLLEWKAVH